MLDDHPPCIHPDCDDPRDDGAFYCRHHLGFAPKPEKDKTLRAHIGRPITRTTVEGFRDDALALVEAAHRVEEHVGNLPFWHDIGSFARADLETLQDIVGEAESSCLSIKQGIQDAINPEPPRRAA